MSDLQKIEATVFVYRHRLTGIVNAHYIDTALNFEETAEWEHVATLNPRAWIEFNYSLVEQRDELLAALKVIANREVRNTHKIDKCEHGQYGYESCEECIYDYAEKVIAKVESEK